MAGKPGEDQGTDWAELIRGLQAAWNKACATAPGRNAQAPSFYTDPANLAAMAQGLLGDLSLASGDQSKQLWEEALQLIECVLGHYGIGPRAQSPQDPRPGLPRSDPRFADPAWRKSPLFALLHQLWLMLAERLPATVASMEKLAPERRQRALFGLRILLEALNPANFPLTNPLVLDRAVKTGGESLLRGLTQLLADLGRGRLTHSDPRAFVLGETIATTPGMVIHQTPLFQLIQYVPVTERVMRTPLVIFPAWINRYYILDIDARKSLVRWALTQGFSVFMVSWKSADESLSGIIWDDYIAAQIEVIEHVRQRLRVPAVHVVGHCVAGTTLAATLAVMARRGNASCVRSATFLTAQVDFSEAGDLACLADDRMIEALGRLAPHGLVDGRYLAATFNLLRSNDLIWKHVEKHYLLGEELPAFDLLHWNADNTNLPLPWLQNFLRDLYRDNRLVEPDSLSACGVPIDLGRIATPSLILAARDDHIAPARSVWKMMNRLGGPREFLLAGSGHVAAVVNPPAAGKYRYWTNRSVASTFEHFLAGAHEHRGSWWPYWTQWLKAHERSEVAVRGRRLPGRRGDRVIELAPGSYARLP